MFGVSVTHRRRRVALLMVTAVLGGTGLGTAWLLRDPLPYFQHRRSSLDRVVEHRATLDDGYELQLVRLVASSGLEVDLMVRRAVADSARRLPLVVLLGGHLTGRSAARLLGDTRGLLVAALSYPFTGHHRPDPVTFIREIPKIRTAFLDTPPALMLALDYLTRRPDVDTTRVEAAGVSLGVPFVCIASALDQRFTRTWAIHGSGGSYVPLEVNMRRTIPFAPVRLPAAVIANVIIAGPRLDPARWVGRIAPRPFVMLNAEGDQQLPRQVIEALYRSAGSPKQLLWLRGSHVRPDTSVVRALAAMVVARIRADSR